MRTLNWCVEALIPRNGIIFHFTMELSYFSQPFLFIFLEVHYILIKIKLIKLSDDIKSTKRNHDKLLPKTKCCCRLLILAYSMLYSTKTFGMSSNMRKWENQLPNCCLLIPGSMPPLMKKHQNTLDP